MKKQHHGFIVVLALAGLLYYLWERYGKKGTTTVNAQGVRSSSSSATSGGSSCGKPAIVEDRFPYGYGGPYNPPSPVPVLVDAGRRV